MQHYTRIKGKLPQKKLPEKCALVLEGGGTRCSYTGGVLDTFLEENILFPYIIGVSAGASLALSYLSGQKGRNKLLLKDHLPKKEYMSFRRCLRGKSFLNGDYVFREIPEKHLYFDWDVFQKAQVNFLTGSFDCHGGKTHWFSKKDIDKTCTPLTASATLPFVSPMMEFQGKKWLDGGLLDPIPIEKSIKDGNEFHVIVLTQNEGYRKKGGMFMLPKWFYKSYPLLIKAFEERTQNYNRQLELCETLEKEGKAIILRPKRPMDLTGIERKTDELLAFYEDGEQEAYEVVKQLKQSFSTTTA